MRAMGRVVSGRNTRSLPWLSVHLYISCWGMAAPGRLNTSKYSRPGVMTSR